MRGVVEGARMASQPELIGDYKILKVLGRGAMGVVYLAVHPSLGRQMALKVMARELAGDPEFVERFRREGEAAAKLRHPNIVQVFDFASRDGMHFIAMEFLGATTLKDLLEESGQQSVLQACQMMDELLSALHTAHKKGIIHRDIKPANVMVTDDGPVALTDFSIAHMKESSKLTQTGAIIGTPEYMAPEQFDGLWDARSDLYAAGIVFYELLTGFSPFRSATMTEVMRKQLLTIPDSPSTVDFSVPESLSAVVSRALAKDPAERYQSAAEMRAAIAEALRQAGIQAIDAPLPQVKALELKTASASEATAPGAPEAVSMRESKPVATSALLAALPVSSPPPPQLAALRAAPGPPLEEAPKPVPAAFVTTAAEEAAPETRPAPASQVASSAGERSRTQIIGQALSLGSIVLAGYLYWGLGVGQPIGTPETPGKTPTPKIALEPTPAAQLPPIIAPADVPRPVTPPPVARRHKTLFPTSGFAAPGHGVENLGLGVGKAKVRKLWGAPSEGVSKKGLLIWAYGGSGPLAKCAVYFNRKGVVETIAVLSPDFSIPGSPNCKVGASYTTIESFYPNPDRYSDTVLDYQDQGILFLFKNKVCTAVFIYGRGRDVGTLQIF